MRRTLSQAKQIAGAVNNLMHVASVTLTDTRSPEKVMQDDIVATLKAELIRRYGQDEYHAGKSAGWTVQMLYQPSFCLTPEQFMFIMREKVTFAPDIARFHRFVRRARQKMYTDRQEFGQKYCACVNEWLSEARKVEK